MICLQIQDCLQVVLTMERSRFLMFQNLNRTTTIYKGCTNLIREFTYNSVCTLSVKNDRNTEEYGLESKIKTIKFIDEERFAFGTSSGVIELHSVENDPAVDKGRNRKSQALRRWNVDGEVKSIQTLALQNRHKERTFMYVTHKGELGIQDINDKDLSVKFNLGKERGMISAMLTSALD